MEVSLTIPVHPGMEVAATAQATALGEYVGLSRDKIDELKLAIIEACVNAFEHAHDEEGRVHFAFLVGTWEDGRAGLEVIVRDHGKGFDPARVEDAAIEKKLHDPRKRGWGLKIIEGLMDRVWIEAGSEGTMIRMRKYK